MNKKIMIIDGNSILNRAYYGMTKLTTKDGIYTNAIFGFLKIMKKYLKEEDPSYLCVTFDLREPTFRHKEYDGYKAKRKGMDDELVMQVPLIKEVLDAMNIKRLEIPGYEADDIIGSLSKKAKESGFDVVILTGDRDALQLVDDRVRVKIPKTKMGKNETEEYDVEKVKEAYNGLEPKALIEVKGLMGDSSDNIPGVKGVGEKTACSLILQFGSIENVYDNIDSITKKSLKENLIRDKDMAFLSRHLGTIYRDLDVFNNSDEFLIKEYDREKLYDIFKKLEFKSLIQEMGLGDEEPSNIKKKVEDVSCIDDVFSLSNLSQKIEKSGSLYFCYNMDKDILTDFVIWHDKKVYNINLKSVDYKSFLSIFKPLFESDDVKKYTHDAKNFYRLLFSNDIKLNNLKFDTMIAGYLLNPANNAFSIDYIASEFLDMTISDASIVEYVDILKDLVFKLQQEIENKNQSNLYYNIELPLVEVLASLEFWGFRIDKNELEQLTCILNEKIDILVSSIYTLAGEEFNINSPKQLGIILCEKLGLKLKKTKTGYSTDAKTLEALSDKSEVVGLILEYRKLAKLKSTYTEGLQEKINDLDGKIHSTFNQTVTVTGRISSTEPNLQNIPIKTELGKLIRKAFIPESDDYVLLDADYSQIELRVLAHITKDPNMIEAFKNGEDIHTNTASRVFGVEPKDVTPIFRRRAKAINFGIIYGMGDFSLSKDLNISRKEAATYIENYFEKYSKVKEYLDNIVEKGKKDGYVSTIFNRVRYLPELTSNNFNIKAFGERVAMNMPIQGSAADIIKIAMVKVYNELKNRNLKSRLILQIHDELLIETRKDEVDEVSKLLKECMENAVCLDVPLTVEVKVGHNWYEAK